MRKAEVAVSIDEEKVIKKVALNEKKDGKN